MARFYAQVNRRRCAACGACLKVCPRGALSIYKGCCAQTDETKCVGCGLCAKTCPAESIRMEKRGEAE